MLQTLLRLVLRRSRSLPGQAIGESVEELTQLVARLQRRGDDAVAGLVAASWLHCFRYHFPETEGFAISELNLELGKLLRYLCRERGAALPPGSAVPRPVDTAVKLLALVDPMNLERFDQAESELRQAVDRATNSVAIRDGLSALAELRYSHYARSGSIDSLSAAADALRDAVNDEPFDAADPGPSVRDLDDLGSLLYRLFQLVYDADLLRESACYHGRAVESAEAGEARRIGLLDNLGASLYKVGEVYREPAALSRSAAAYREALAATARYSGQWWALAEKLSIVLRLVPEVCGPGADLNAAVDEGRALLTLCDGHLDRSWRLFQTIAALVGGRFQLNKDQQDLNEKIDYLQQARSACPRANPEWAALTADLGASLASRFDLVHERADLEKGIEYMESAAVDLPEAEQVVLRHNLKTARARVEGL